MPNYYKVLDATIVLDAHTSDAVNIEGANGIAIEVPTFAVGLNTASASLVLSGAEESDGTFRTLYALTAASGYDTLTVLSGSAGGVTVLLGPEASILPKFIKVTTTGTNSTATTAGLAVKVHMYI